MWGASTSYNPIGLHGLLQGQLYLYLLDYIECWKWLFQLLSTRAFNMIIITIWHYMTKYYPFLDVFSNRACRVLTYKTYILDKTNAGNNLWRLYRIIVNIFKFLDTRHGWGNITDVLLLYVFYSYLPTRYIYIYIVHTYIHTVRTSVDMIYKYSDSSTSETVK
jgi:hypothetical protein